MGTRPTTSSLMYNGMLTQRANQPVAWQQFNALGHVDMVTLNEVNMVVGAVGLRVSQTTGPLGFFAASQLFSRVYREWFAPVL